jgi:hypothetical protein
MVVKSVVCWDIWKTRNKVTFQKLRTPREIAFLASSPIMYWEGLHKEKDRELLQLGATKMMETTSSPVRLQRPGMAHW